MTIFLIVSYVYPNGQNLRPELTGDSIFYSGGAVPVQDRHAYEYLSQYACV